MSHAILFNIPTLGHLRPMLPVAAELHRRREQVTFFNTPGYQDPIETTGATFRPYPAWMGDDYFGELDGSNPLATAHTLAEDSLRLLPTLLKQMEALQPDYIIFDSMCPWGRMVAQMLGVPKISSNSLMLLTPFMILGSGQLPHMVPLLMGNLHHLRGFVRARRQIQQAYGIKVPFFPDFLMQRGDLTLSYTAEAIQPRANLYPEAAFVGPSLAEPREETFTPPSQKLVYISLGTVINRNLAFFHMCLQAFDGADYTVLISLGKGLDPAMVGPLPANIRVETFVPQLEVLQHADVFVTHGGMNSTHEALYYGVPLVLVPQQSEQYIVAKRLAALGVGRLLTPSTPTPEHLRQAVDGLLAQPPPALNDLQSALREAGGAQRAAEVVLGFIAQSS